MKTCAHCGQKLLPNETGCPRCGFDPSEPAAPPLDHTRYRTKSILALTAVVLSVLAVVFYVILHPGQLPSPKEPSSAGSMQVNLPSPSTPVSTAGAWEFDGRVLDLATLSPIPDAALNFAELQSGTVVARSDPAGRYKVSLPPLGAGSYQLSATHPGYISRDFSGTAETFEKRKEMAANPEGYDQPDFHPPWVGIPGQIIHRDILLLPEKAKP